MSGLKTRCSSRIPSIDYVQTDQGNFSVVLHGRENALLGEYIHDLAEQAYQHLQDALPAPARRADSRRAVPGSRRFFSALGRAGRRRVARRLLRAGGGDGFARRAHARRVQLGLHAVARARPRIPLVDDRNRVPRWFCEGTRGLRGTALPARAGAATSARIFCSPISTGACCRSAS